MSSHSQRTFSQHPIVDRFVRGAMVAAGVLIMFLAASSVGGCGGPPTHSTPPDPHAMASNARARSRASLLPLFVGCTGRRRSKDQSETDARNTANARSL